MANVSAQARGARAATPIGVLVWAQFRLAVMTAWDSDAAARFRGGLVAAFGAALIAAFATYDPADPSWNAASDTVPTNLLGGFGSAWADAGLQSLGLAAWVAALLMVATGLSRAGARDPRGARGALRLRAAGGALGVLLLAGALAAPVPPAAWPLARALGGFWGDGVLALLSGALTPLGVLGARTVANVIMQFPG